jgi:arylsulfatase A
MLRLISILFSGLIIQASGWASAGPDPPPNIILILADDLGWGDVGFNGRKEWKTPNLDRLAKQGTVFKRFYAAGVTCGPSRAALMTGRYGIHNGVTANDDDLPDTEVTIAQALKEQGYVTGLFGKWHHGKNRPGKPSFRHPMDLGFDEFFGFADANSAHEKYPKKLWFGREEHPTSGYSEELFTDRALDFIKRKQKDRFFLYLPYTNPHFKLEVPEEDMRHYRGKFPEKDPNKPVNATYAAMISNLDKQIGRVLKTLDELRMSENTIVIFTSDQGATFETGNMGASASHDSNRPFRGQKRTLWEGGIRVPAVVRWPGKVAAGKTSEAICHFVDMFPTVISVTGGPSTQTNKLDGVDLLPSWTGNPLPPERTIFWEWRQEGVHQYAAMRGNMKLVITGSEPAELYDVTIDLGERRNVIAEQPDIAFQLRKELIEWQISETDEAKWGKPSAKMPQK